jgi:signal transduction histidine kinase
MDLATFIESASEEILREAVTFARSIPCISGADEERLRDHLGPILQVIASDMRGSQSRAASIAKSHGRAAAGKAETDADEHGLQRAKSGLDIEQLVAEYRALRSSVLRLWSERYPPNSTAIVDINRFNEAVDQAIAESVRAFAKETKTRRQLFIAALGHDLRGPLNAVMLSAQAIALQQASSLPFSTEVLLRSADRMEALLESLLDFNIVGLGGSIALQMAPVDLRAECMAELQVLQAANPRAIFEVTGDGQCFGNFDASRMREALGNLVNNAVRHGAPQQPIQIQIQGRTDSVRVMVSNQIEELIPPADLPLLFEPLTRRSSQRRVQRTSLGLGLFITKEIAAAHGGAASAAIDGTTISFLLDIPRVAGSPAVA